MRSSSSFKASLSLPCLLPLLLLAGLAQARVPGVEFINNMMVKGLSKDWDMTALVAEPLVVPQTGSKESDLVLGGLPGQKPQVQYPQYAGYVMVDATAGRALFYYFVEAIDNATSKPLVLWLSSGPGCSSLGDQALMGHGPYRVSTDGQTIYGNNASLLQEANVIYLESTTGTGFSYSNTSSDYKGLNDRKISEDNFRFLVNWLERFPEYKERMFFVGGEGYGASYAAQLMQLILNYNDAGGHTNITFSGILLGNAIIDAESSVKGYLDNLWGHGMISRRLFNVINATCGSPFTRSCQMAHKFARQSVAPNYPYDFSASICNLTPPSNQPIQNVDSLYECSEKNVAEYLNNPEVQKALHVNPMTIPQGWRQCNDGDTDLSVPLHSTRYSLKKLNLTVAQKWSMWTLDTFELAGRNEIYKEGILLTTVRECGHIAAKTHSNRSLGMYKVFLDAVMGQQKKQ
ncbi:Serine carboxypeptidase-like 40 [Acorus calamus]|uniref:Serine carboxypeptidase-like 40 n=1 Tax=Acorus calamus TaxID=4465 RepID=A0AAV9FF98_ACOCL|nr:Serine carboxypeptidase-like 40 [Acorus calamus]